MPEGLNCNKHYLFGDAAAADECMLEAIKFAREDLA